MQYVHALLPLLPHAGHRVWAIHQRQGTVYLPRLHTKAIKINLQYALYMFKKILALIVIAASALAASAQKGESAFGVQTGYTSTNNSAIVGLFYQYGLSNVVRISPELGFVVRHQNYDAFTADVNVHFPLNIGLKSMELYPLAGLNFSSWTKHNRLLDDIDDVSTRRNCFGLNFGAGWQLQVSESIKLKIEAKYLLTSRFSTFTLGFGVGYVF